MIRHVVVVLSASLLLSASAFAAAPQSAQDASGNLQRQVAETQQKVDQQKQKTQALQDKVDTLKKKNKTARQNIERSDRVLARLHEQLAELGVDGAGGADSQ